MATNPLFIRQFGGNSAKTAATTIGGAVPAGGVAIGQVLIVGCGTINGGGTSDTVTDTKGNTYTLLASVGTTSGARLFGTVVTTALVLGDTITYTTTTGSNARAITVLQFDANAGNPGTVAYAAASGNATSTTPNQGGGINIATSHAVAAIVVINGPTTDTFTNDGDTVGGVAWTQGAANGTSGGLATSNIRIARATKDTLTSAATQEYNPTITSEAWWAIILDVPNARTVPRNPAINHQNPGVL